MTEQGKLVVFEGPDGVGKSTLAQNLAEHLNACSIPCEYLAFPGRELGSLGYHIYRLHHFPSDYDVTSINPTSLQLLHIAAHIDAIENRILPLLRAGHFVILDRFWWSTWVYGVVSGANQRALKAMLRVEHEQWGKVLPTLAFLISRATPWREGETFDDKWHKLSTAYYELAKDEQHKHPIFTVSNDGSLGDALGQMLDAIYRTVDGLPSEVCDLSSAEENSQLRLDISTDEAIVASFAAAPAVIKLLLPARPTEVYETYWRFAAERQSIFFKRFEDAQPPWTKDPILARHKFTNAYRASDRVSQFLIRHVIYEGDESIEEICFRTLLFRLFNRIGTWQLLQRQLGTVSYADYSFERYDEILSNAIASGDRIFSAAYIMPSGSGSFDYVRKHRNYLKLLEKLMSDEVPARISEMQTMRDVFELLRSYPMLGDFLAYQYSIDINYSQVTHFSEMEFVVPGPGARDGIRKCFQDLGGLSEANIIRLVAERQQEEFGRLELVFRSLWGRPLQLIDCQNLFCEVDKYARIAHPHIKGISDRKRIKQIYQAHEEPIEYWYPPKWNINHLIEATSHHVSNKEGNCESI